MTIDPRPASFSDRLLVIIGDYDGVEGALLPLLHDVQGEFGFIPDFAVEVIARSLSLSRAEVDGVVSFYHDFRREGGARHVVRLCRAEACQARGAAALADHAHKRLGLGWNERARDGSIALEAVFCLGLCACGPAAMVDGRPVGRLDAERLDAMLEEMGLEGIGLAEMGA